MKNNQLNYSTADDVNAIVCNLSNVRIYIIPTHENELKITCENGKRIVISRDENCLTVNQSSRPSIFTGKNTIIYLSIPDHTLPDISVEGKNCTVNIASGIYGSFSLACNNGKTEFTDCSFADCELIGDTLSTYLKGVTVRNTLVVKCFTGDMIWENSFASCTECRVKRGNIGLCGFSCKDSIMEAENGSVAARLNGDERDYNLGLLIKEGTSNRESVKREGAARSFKAYSAKGNIAIDFIPDKDYVYSDN